MEPILKFARRWGAPVAAGIFFALWCVAEAGRMGPNGGHWGPGSLDTWEGTWPLVLMTLAIAVAVWQPTVSLALTGLLLIGQLAHLIPPMYANYWAIYIGSFIALAFIAWTTQGRMRLAAAGANVLFASSMTFLMLSWRYGAGVGWFSQIGGDSGILLRNGWQLFALLMMIAAACFSLGLLLSLYQERGSLFRARELAERTLQATEVDLIVEQERTRIARDLHDVLAHSLAVIAAQADGSRYLSRDQPKAVLGALENIAGSARTALVDAQRVIEGVRGDGMAVPQPQFTDIEGLVEGLQHGSLKIQTSESGTRMELSRGQQVAVFRIVQECLTNALKHGGRGTAVRLHFNWSGPGLTVHVASEVSSSKHGHPVIAGPQRLGRGLPGMRERAHSAGGWITAGPDGEQFRVTAFIPYLTDVEDSARENIVEEHSLTHNDLQVAAAGDADRND
ncbi:sensor histidine kinase [Pseudarthrobacter polychromogenes]|uniref:histidine kinase n=1 Tax=Pseudarthrobacter polychromogenes TaxID=1676 RepID=A0ABQ1X9R4_9MICC|nr:histidine kinase [Pseudarthrobacter polychromogenes]GGG85064.1 two-component sensor histidine kinase [Pseudarthrobacter polychromogenes]